MRLFCDQNIMKETVGFLRELGHDVVSTREAGIQHGSDSEILEYAVQNDRFLVTHNTDFGDLRLFPPETHSGIIRLRINDQTADSLHPVLKSAFERLKRKDLAGKLVTVKPGSIRIRGKV